MTWNVRSVAQNAGCDILWRRGRFWGNCCGVVLLPWVFAASMRFSSTALVVDDLWSQDTHPHCSRQNSLNWPDAMFSTFLVAIFEIPSVSFLRLRGGGQLNYPRRHPSGNYRSEQADKQTTTWRFNFWEQARSFIQTSSSCQEFQPPLTACLKTTSIFDNREQISHTSSWIPINQDFAPSLFPCWLWPPWPLVRTPTIPPPPQPSLGQPGADVFLIAGTASLWFRKWMLLKWNPNQSETHSSVQV